MLKSDQTIWSSVRGLEKWLEASNTGLVRSVERYRLPNPKILKPYINAQGYYRLNFTANSKSRHIPIHRAVALAFLPNPNNLPQINHIDGDKLNNHVNNLEWCTVRHNINHAYAIGLSIRRKGSQRKNVALLNEKQVREIRDKYIPIKYSQFKLAKEYGISRSTIQAIIERRNWQHI